MGSQQKQWWYKPLLKHRDEKKSSPGHTNFQKVFFSFPRITNKKKAQGISSPPNWFCFQLENAPLLVPGVLHDHPSTPAPSPAAAILSQLLGKAGPCIQSSKGHSSNTALAPRKGTGTPRCRFSTENTFRASVHAFPEGSTATVSSAGSAISV